MRERVRIGSIKECRIRRHAEAALHRLLDTLNRDIVPALAADREVVMIPLPIQVDGEGQVLRRRELGQPPLQFERVGAKVNVLLARDEAVDDLDNLRMQQRLTTGNRNHRHAALFNRGETLFRRELLLQNVRRILHLAAPCAGQVAAEERLQHQHQRIALVAGELLLQHIFDYRPHLRDRNRHLS